MISARKKNEKVGLSEEANRRLQSDMVAKLTDYRGRRKERGPASSLRRHIQRIQQRQGQKEDILGCTITQPYVPFYQQNFPTPSGKIEFYVESLVPYDMPLPVYHEPVEASPSNSLYQKYPLVLLTSHTKFRTHTQWNNLSWLLEINPKQFMEINPTDATSRGISDGDTVTIFNDRGSITTVARVTSGMRPGVVNVYQGDWQEFPNGTVNMLTHQKINPAQSVVYLFQSNTAYFDVLVGVKKS